MQTTREAPQAVETAGDKFQAPPHPLTHRPAVTLYGRVLATGEPMTRVDADEFMEAGRLALVPVERDQLSTGNPTDPAEVPEAVLEVRAALSKSLGRDATLTHSPSDRARGHHDYMLTINGLIHQTRYDGHNKAFPGVVAEDLRHKAARLLQAAETIARDVVKAEQRGMMLYLQKPSEVRISCNEIEDVSLIVDNFGGDAAAFRKAGEFIELLKSGSYWFDRDDDADDDLNAEAAE